MTAVRVVIGSFAGAWYSHLALVGGCLWAVRVHTVYRVPSTTLAWLLPWLGLAVTVTSVLMLILSLLPRSEDGRIAAALRRVQPRSVWPGTLIIPTCIVGAAFAPQPWIRSVFFSLGVVVSATMVLALGQRLIAETGVTLTGALRWLHGAALVAIGGFLLWSLIVFVNGALDRSAAVGHGSDVVAVATSAIDVGLGDLVPHAQVELRSWRNRLRSERVALTPEEADHVWVGEPVTVSVRAGWLGIPWVAALTRDEMRYLQHLLATSPAASHVIRELVVLAVERRQWDEALALARRYGRLYPDDTAIVEHVAGMLGIAGRYADQIALIEELVARRPDYSTLCMLGFALDRSENHQRAILVLERAVALRPDVFLARHYLGEAYQALGRRKEAIAAYEGELRVRPQSLEVRRRIRMLRDASAAR